jgi:tripartite-type tricarboxylate transporter receptor subunit TctC
MNRLILATLCSLVAVTGHAAYPDKPIKLIVPASAGTITAVLAREFAQSLSSVVKQTVIVENIAGAEQVIGTQAVVRSEPDGHTALFVSSSTTILDPLLKKSLPYDPSTDLAPVCGIARVGNILYVSAALPYKSTAELLAGAKAQPGKLSFANSSATTRLAGELFQQKAGVSLLSVPYRATSAGLTDVAGGQVSMMFIDQVSASPYVQSGKIRPLAASGSQRHKALPDVPSASEGGVPGYEIWPTIAVFLPAKTPTAIVAQLRDSVAQALKTPAFAATREKAGLEEFSPCGDALTKYQQSEMERWTQVIKNAGIEKQ